MTKGIKSSFLKNSKILWFGFSGKRRKQYCLLSLLMVISAFSEVLSLGALLPFLAVLTDPARVLSNPLVAKYSHYYQISSPESLVLPLTVLFISAAIIAGLIRLFQLWVSTRLSFSVGVDISARVYRNILYQPYSLHLARNSSEVVNDILHNVNSVTYGVLFPLLTIVSSIVLLISVLATLFFF